MMQNDFSSTIARYNIVKEARVYRDDIAIAAVDTQEDRIVAAQAADELLNIAGISASFVVFHEKNSINISARSIGHINVQLVWKSLEAAAIRPQPERSCRIKLTRKCLQHCSMRSIPI